jgi:lipopolysaccharide/colanic/teichoic acid biosynthesis glycosyltransferase
MLNNVFLPHFTSYKTRRRGGPRCLLEQEFEERLCYERKRAERSRDSLILMLVHRNENHADLPIEPVLQAALNPIAGTIRDTDIVGWCRGRAVLGVLFTELKSKTSEPLIRILKEKIVAALSGALTRDDFQALQLSFHSFPEDFNSQKGKHALPPLIYPDVVGVSEARKAQLLVKRIMDLVGSAFALTILSPLFLLLALAIKCTSRGPVLFRQERLGQFGVPFVFLKFRSMYVSNSPAIHRDFVRSFIAGNQPNGSAAASQKRCFKITNDPRITPLGRFMRRTSLDELPQFWNVLRGEMSLVGPRPPIPYEIDAYEAWHRRRLYEAKPGITGSWQVHGRSRTTFDEMVRLDLRYAREWSPALDLKILMQTPRAVCSGDGAF